LKIVQFGLCFSPNLGDGIIAECIAYGLVARNPQAEVAHVDLSARRARGDIVIRNRETILAIADRLPLSVRQFLARWKLNRLLDGVTDAWTKAAEADLAVIGGGQIFSDANLNFPLKIGRTAQILAEKGTACAVYGVGVSSNWTPQGTELFRQLERAQLRMVGVRDAGSLAAWQQQMPGNPRPEITLDPGLLAAACYGPVAPVKGNIGLCVTDFALLAHHADGHVAGQAAGGLAFFTSVALATIKAGHTVTLFCNGAAEDLALLRRLTKTPELANLLQSGQAIIPEPPKTPAELAKTIAGCEAVIAHRLHACIIAYSYQRPVVGLGWDSKLQSFFELAGIAGSFSADPDITADHIVGMARAAIEAGISTKDHVRLMGEAWDGIDRLLNCVKADGS